MLTTQTQARAARRKVWLLAGLALLVQLALAALTENYPYDASCFSAWALRMGEVGPAGFYADGYFCDYPPGYLLLLWLPGKLLRSFSGEGAQRVVLAFIPALATAAMGPLVYGIARRHGADAPWATRCAAAVLFCPALLYNTGVWGQIDGLFSLAVLACFALLEEKRWLPGAFCFGLALAIKPQALLAGPALAICFLLPAWFGANARARLRALADGALGALAALAPVLLCGLPFWGLSGLGSGLLEKYFTTTSSYPYATINAANGMALLGGEWVAQEQPVGWLGTLPLPSWQQLGTAWLVLLTAFCAWLAWRAHRAGRFSPVLLAGLYTVGVFTFSHRMHERYLIFAAVLVLAAAARMGSRRLLALGGGLSLVSLLNMALVYGTVSTDDEFLTSATSALMLRAVGLAEVVLFALLAAVAWQLCAPLPTGARGQPRQRSRPAAPALPPLCAVPAPQPRWSRREALALAGLTLAVAAVSFAYLGDLTAPQTLIDLNGSTASYTVTVEGEAATLWVYPGISTSGAGLLTVTDASGQPVAELQLYYGNPFTWQSLSLGGGQSYTITISDGQVIELQFRDADGTPLAVAGEAADTALFDEQTLVPQTFSQLNSFYFDEIYHARTAYEMLHGMQVYETTHPPLGKDLILLGIALFGMTGFGWRFAGTLFGVLLVPLLYCFVRRLSRQPWAAGFAAALLALDFLRFSQSRLATIDTYAVFFILLAADLMVWYCQSVLQKGVMRSVLPMALCGAAFGCGCAAKWTGIYAGAGLAILYFAVLWQRGRQLCAGANAPADGLPRLKREIAAALAGGVAFFVVLPLLIYWASYLPYLWRDSSFGLADWWDCQKYMYWYHSTLEATHGFASGWYSWLLDLRPVWYYMGGGLPAGTYASIAGFVSPVVALGGLAAWLRLAQRQLVGRGSRAGAAVLIFTLSSLLPWVLVTRCTFLYHYFPCVPMLCAAAALCLARLGKHRPALARRLALGVLAAAAALFLWFYPVLSGLPVSAAWAASLKWLSSWGFYIL